MHNRQFDNLTYATQKIIITSKIIDCIICFVFTFEFNFQLHHVHLENSAGLFAAKFKTWVNMTLQYEPLKIISFWPEKQICALDMLLKTSLIPYYLK